MSEQPRPGSLPAQIQVLQIITGALIAGVAMFLAVVLVLHQQGDFAGLDPGMPILSWIAAGEFVVILGVWMILPRILVRQGLGRIARDGPDPITDTRRLLALKQSTHIVSCALLEGSAFLALIGYLLEKQPYTLGIALACLLLMLLTFPTHDRVTRWLGEQQDQLEELRRTC